MPPALKICFAASEVSPWAKTGGLADVASALPARLRRSGHDVRAFLPFYSSIDTAEAEVWPVEFIQQVPVTVGWRTFSFSARTLRSSADGADLYLIDCPELYHRPGIYTTDDDEVQRFAVFSRAVIECCQRMGWAPDVFHCNDWHTALIPLLLRSVYDWDRLFAGSRSLLTIHNIGYQGELPAERLDDLGLAPWRERFDQRDLGAGRVNLLRTGLLHADWVSTVSPTYASEIRQDGYGMGLQDLLNARRATLAGILNGVDYDEWSPERDRFIPRRYSAGDLDGKLANKRHLLERLGLVPADGAPLIGIVSRLTHQKGFDLGFEVLPELLGRVDLRLAVLGSGEARYEEYFESLQRAFPGRVCFHRGYHEELAHVIEAAADMLLMPSRYEPCGLNQMFSLRYGTIPIVRGTGGLADTVRPFDHDPASGTGFAFEHATADGLRWALALALRVWDDRAAWNRLMRNAMAADFSWSAQAERYVELYRRMLA